MKKNEQFTKMQKTALYVSIGAIVYIYSDFAQFIYQGAADYYYAE